LFKGRIEEYLGDGMKTISYQFVILMLGFGSLSAQTYLQQVRSELATSFGLPSGVVVSNANEVEVLAEALAYGVTRTDFIIQDEVFTNGLRISSPTQLGETYDHAAIIRNTEDINEGDRLLFVCYVRAEEVQGEQNVMRIWAEENGGAYDKYGGGIVYATDEWQRILIPFEATNDIQAGEVQMAFQIGFLTQTVEIAGPILLNYETAVNFSDLPNERAPTSYVGQELSAAWRVQAAAQIDQHRKADLTVRVTDLNGNPIQGQSVAVRMQQHAYGFGSAVVSCFVDDLRCANPIYESKMRNIDGEGHRFSEVVFENDLKWRGWEQQWYETNEGVVQALAFYRDTLGMNVRGHTLLWPCARNMPDDVVSNLTDTAYVLGRIRDHFSELLTTPGIAGRIQDWDLLNEIAVCNSVADAFEGQEGYVTGREFYPSLFRLAKSLDPAAEFWYNDYQVIQQGGFSPARQQTFYDRANEILDAGAPLSGVGLQSHVAYPIPPVKINALFDEVYDRIGVPMKVTEFDMDAFANEQIEADFMRDFLTVTFAHPHTEAFLSWGFWDGAHFRNNAPFFRQDWTVKPSGQAFFDLVYNEWWTDATLSTDANGIVTLRGFKGDYKIEVLGESKEINLVGSTQVDFELSTSADQDVQLLTKPGVFPNPTQAGWTIRGLPLVSYVYLFDSRGKRVAFAKTNLEGDVIISAEDLVSGVYTAKVKGFSFRLIKI